MYAFAVSGRSTHGRANRARSFVCAVVMVLLAGRVVHAQTGDPPEEVTNNNLTHSATISTDHLKEETEADRSERIEQALMAADIAEDLRARVQRYDSLRAAYPDQLIDDLANYYRYGVGSNNQIGTADDQGHPLVTRKACRDVVTELYMDMFFITPRVGDNFEETVDDRHGEDVLANRLSKETSKKLRQQLTEFLDTAFKDLSLVQRKRLYYISGEILDAHENAAALRILRNYALPDKGLTKGERDAIKDAIAKITS